MIRPASRAAVALFAALSIAAACGRSPATSAPAPVAAPAPAASAVPPGSTGSTRDSTAAPATVPADTANVSSDDVKKAALEVFGDSAAPIVEEVVEAEEPTWDLDVRPYETQERVAHYVKMFSGPAKDRFAARLERGSQYEPMLRAKLRAAGLPEDMVYLALIESGYDPHAYSRAAAVGMWQIMTATGKGVGLRIDWWVDERRDPIRSTDAAIRFLRYLNDQFGSLYLAAAAYNGGPTRVARGLTRHADDMGGATGEDRFFALAETDFLRAETRNYVPQLIAAALVAKEPERYGLNYRRLPEYAFDSVRVPATTPLAAVATATQVPLAKIVELNPHVLRGVTPPKIPFTVRVPVGAAAGFDSSFAALPENERKAFTRITSKKGETLVTLARRAKVTTKQLGWYNQKIAVARKSGRVVAGQTILVPSAQVVAGARDVPNPAIEIYGSSRRAVYHTVKRGETLSGIAKRYKTTTGTIMRLNGLRKSVIIPGQRLVVKGSAAPARRAAGRNSARKRPAATTTKKAATGTRGSGTVKSAPKRGS